MKDSSEIILTEHNNNTNTGMFSIEESFTMGPHTILNVHRNSTRDASLITFSGKDAYFRSSEECQITVNQVGAVLKVFVQRNSYLVIKCSEYYLKQRLDGKCRYCRGFH